MSYKISKELFEAVMEECGFIRFYEEDYSRPDRINYTISSNHILDGSYSDENISINDFFFECINFMKNNTIKYSINIDNDIRNEVFGFLNNYILDNKEK